MKVLWCARLARPDLNKGISDLARRLACWSVADDKRLHRLMSYLFGSRNFTLQGYIGDPPESLKLCCYTDADHCSAQEDSKSTSGLIMTLAGRSNLSIFKTTQRSYRLLLPEAAGKPGRSVQRNGQNTQSNRVTHEEFDVELIETTTCIHRVDLLQLQHGH